ncbi:hypothetical protein GALL_331890 [mine drainage metagenome]|uniref:Uncharacterized protein n=1 Tax=mine drainage metagenome TaxID=410659 RepID=A0A1J5QZ42_9ZZZZ
MDAYAKIMRDIPDADLAELVAERQCLDQCAGLERELIVRWLAARDLIEWLQAEQQRAARIAGLGRDEMGLMGRRGNRWKRGNARVLHNIAEIARTGVI